MASIRVNRVIKELESQIAKVIGKVVLDVQSNLREVTPIDTGWARANWQITIASAAASTVGTPQAPGPGRAGELIALGYKLTQGIIYLANNVPYIAQLNAGSSVQAPPAFVQLAIAQGLKGRGLIADLPGALQTLIPNNPHAFQ